MSTGNNNAKNEPAESQPERPHRAAPVEADKGADCARLSTEAQSLMSTSAHDRLTGAYTGPLPSTLQGAPTITGDVTGSDRCRAPVPGIKTAFLGGWLPSFGSTDAKAAGTQTSDPWMKSALSDEKMRKDMSSRPAAYGLKPSDLGPGKHQFVVTDQGQLALETAYAGKHTLRTIDRRESNGQLHFSSELSYRTDSKGHRTYETPKFAQQPPDLINPAKMPGTDKGAVQPPTALANGVTEGRLADSPLSASRGTHFTDTLTRDKNGKVNERLTEYKNDNIVGVSRAQGLSTEVPVDGGTKEAMDLQSVRVKFNEQTGAWDRTLSDYSGKVIRQQWSADGSKLISSKLDPPVEKPATGGGGIERRLADAVKGIVGADHLASPIATLKHNWDPQKGVPQVSDLLRQRFKDDPAITGAIDRAAALQRKPAAADEPAFDALFRDQLSHKSFKGDAAKAYEGLQEARLDRAEVKTSYARDALAATAFQNGAAPPAGERFAKLAQSRDPHERELAQLIAGRARNLAALPDSEMNAKISAFGKMIDAAGHGTRDGAGEQERRRAAIAKSLTAPPADLTWYPDRGAGGVDAQGDGKEGKISLAAHTVQAFLDNPVLAGYVAAAADPRHDVSQYGTMFRIKELDDATAFQQATQRFADKEGLGRPGMTRDQFFQAHTGMTYDQWMDKWGAQYAERYGVSLQGIHCRRVDIFGDNKQAGRFDLCTDYDKDRQMEPWNSRNYPNGQNNFTMIILDQRIDGVRSDRTGNYEYARRSDAAAQARSRRR